MILITKYLFNFPIDNSGTDTQAWNLGICSGKDGFLFHLPPNNAANITVIEPLINTVSRKIRNQLLLVSKVHSKISLHHLSQQTGSQMQLNPPMVQKITILG